VRERAITVKLLERARVMDNYLVQCDFCGEWYENEREGEGE
jgi:formylmethanofuran dehydrogenase subunit E